MSQLYEGKTGIQTSVLLQKKMADKTLRMEYFSIYNQIRGRLCNSEITSIYALYSVSRDNNGVFFRFEHPIFYIVLVSGFDQ